MGRGIVPGVADCCSGEAALADRIRLSLIHILLALVLHFFLFSVDYSRTERVQFEDDEYYYYVKAVPKMSVTTRKKQIKKINAKKDDRRSERY